LCIAAMPGNPVSIAAIPALNVAFASEQYQGYLS